MGLSQHLERYPPLKWVFGACGLLILAIGYGLLLLTGNDQIATGVTVAKIPVGGLTPREAVIVLEKKLDARLHRQIILTYQKRNIGITLDSIGIEPDYRLITEKAHQIGRTGPFWQQALIRWQTRRRGFEIPLLFKSNRDTWLAFYRLLEAAFAVEPVRSVVKVTPEGEVGFSASKTGRIIPEAKLLRQIEAVVSDGNNNHVTLPFENEVPPLTESEIQSWSLNKVLGKYYTVFNPAMTDRVHNLKMACGALDNILVYPGQKFSFNTWVGPRVPEAGYREAPVIFMGKLVAGIGGGICQVSSTLYNAVLFSNLKVIERYNHTLPSSYVPLARDATLVDGGLDFVFENSNPKPILITARVVTPYVIVAILGDKAGWEKVALETVVVQTFPTWVKEIPDPTLTADQRIKVQDGKPGFKAELWRTITLTDGLTRKMRVNTSIYPAQPEEYKVGTKPIPVTDGDGAP